MKKEGFFLLTMLSIFILFGCSLGGGGGGGEDGELSFNEVKKLAASDAEDEDDFGCALDISGDYAIVGAEWEGGAGHLRGAAYVFYHNQGGPDNWGEVKKLTAGNAEDNDYFGASVAIAGDYIMVGALYEDEAGSNSGAVHVFQRDQGGAGNWGEVKKFTAADTADSDNFGNSVDLTGDYAIVGAVLEDGAGTNPGAAYIFYGNEGGANNWGEIQKLTASDAADNDEFGFSVAIMGIYAIVGAPYEDGTGTDRGAAYIFYRDQGGPNNWGQVKKLTAGDAEDNAFFGNSVAIAGDYAVVGAYVEDGAGSNRGAAYVFYRNQGGADNWGQVKKLTAGDAEDNDYFGASVAIAGDYIMVGAYNEAGAGIARGAVYLFYRDQGGPNNWGQVAKLTESDTADWNRFGNAAAMTDDYAVLGASTAGVMQCGAAYIYKKQ